MSAGTKIDGRNLLNEKDLRFDLPHFVAEVVRVIAQLIHARVGELLVKLLLLLLLLLRVAVAGFRFALGDLVLKYEFCQTSRQFPETQLL